MYKWLYDRPRTRRSCRRKWCREQLSVVIKTGWEAPRAEIHYQRDLRWSVDLYVHGNDFFFQFFIRFTLSIYHASYCFFQFNVFCGGIIFFLLYMLPHNLTVPRPFFFPLSRFLCFSPTSARLSTRHLTLWSSLHSLSNLLDVILWRWCPRRWCIN